MNLEIAQEIIEQEALLILLERPHLKFDINNGFTLAKIFKVGDSKVVAHLQTYTTYNLSYFYHTFEIAHPIHGTGYYSIIKDTQYQHPLGKASFTKSLK